LGSGLGLGVGLGLGLGLGSGLGLMLGLGLGLGFGLGLGSGSGWPELGLGPLGVGLLGGPLVRGEGGGGEHYHAQLLVRVLGGDERAVATGGRAGLVPAACRPVLGGEGVGEPG